MLSKAKLVAIFTVGLFIISLLVPGQFRFRRSRRSSQSVYVEVEMAQLNQAFNSFRSEFSSRVPGSLLLTEDLAELAPQDRATLRRLWPQLNFKAQYDFNSDGDTEDTFQLSGAECLVFFLGGVSKNKKPVGFSRNPLQPFRPNSQPRLQFFEFEDDRLTDVDSDGFPEDADGLSDAPFLYVNSMRGSKADVTVYPKGDPRNLKALPATNGKQQDTQIISAGFNGSYDGLNFSTTRDGNSDDIIDRMR